MTRQHRRIHACLHCGCLVHGNDGCHPQPPGDLIPLPCTACGRPAVYLSGIDRYVHRDSRRDNAPCWLTIAQGNVNKVIERANCRILAQPRRRRLNAA